MATLTQDAYYEIQWLVPAANSISGKSYWSPMDLSDGTQRTRSRKMAMRDFATALCNHASGTVRLVQWNLTVLDGGHY